MEGQFSFDDVDVTSSSQTPSALVQTFCIDRSTSLTRYLVHSLTLRRRKFCINGAQTLKR